MDADEQWRLAQGLRFCAALLSASAVLVDGVVATPHVGGLGEELLADLRKASRHLHAGVDEARALMPCLQNFAHATMIRKGVRSTRNSSSGPQIRADIMGHAGFASLPADAQGLILTLVKQRNERDMADGGREVSRVCRFLEAHAFLDARRATQLPHDTASLRSLATLPYSPAVQHLCCTVRHFSRSLCAMLAAHPTATPHLTALQLTAHGDPSVCTALVAVLAHNMQLVDLNLDTSDPLVSSGVPVTLQLPRLVQLRALDIAMAVAGDGAAAGTPLGLANLTAMRQLTLLAVRIGVSPGVPAHRDQPYAAAAMQPVANALASLTALRRLQLDSWTAATYPAAHASWQTLASALPTLPHLDALCLPNIVFPAAFDPFPINTLCASLSRLSSLRKLVLTGYSDCAADASHTADCRAASARLAATVGALTGLQRLELFSLRRFLRASDCHRHLRCLTNLSRLDFSLLVPVLPGDEGGVGGACLGSMLSGMTQLRCLDLYEHDYCAEMTHRLLTEAVGALPVLETLILPDGMEHTLCLLLAAKVKDGRLPYIQRVGVEQTDEQLAELNACAMCPVFQLPGDVWDWLDSEYNG